MISMPNGLLTDSTTSYIETVRIVKSPARNERGSFRLLLVQHFLKNVGPNPCFSLTLLTLLFLCSPFETVKSVRMLPSSTVREGFPKINVARALRGAIDQWILPSQRLVHIRQQEKKIGIRSERRSPGNAVPQPQSPNLSQIEEALGRLK